VHLFRYLSVLFVLVIGIRLQAQDDGPGQKRRGSQIIDDTTKQIYGPKTSRYFYEEDVFYNRNVVHPIDTVIRNFHRWNFVQQNNNLYQDLGNIGMAIRPIYFKPPSVIGVRSGSEVFDLYWDSEKIRYFDTKSPFTNMKVVLGGKGRSYTKVTYSRNINPRWNFGINYRTILVDKQVPLRTGKGDRVTKSNYYDAFTSFHTKDSVYRAFVNFQRIFHRVFESGGVDLSDKSDTVLADYFDKTAVVWLNAAESNDLRMNFHFSHQLQAGKALQVYHTLDRYRQKAGFIDNYKTDKRFFSYVDPLGERGDSIVHDTTNNVSKFKIVRNEFGIKGNLLKLFYNGYYAIRHYSMTYYHYNWLQDSLKVPALGNESYIGGRMELNLDSIGLINGWVEADQDGDLRIEGNIVSRWFDGSLRQLLYKPSFASQSYIGKHNKWNNTFDKIESSQINGNIHYRSKVLNVSPGITFTRLGNYTFFQQNPDTTSQRVISVQSSGSQVWFAPEIKWSFTVLKHFTFSNQTIYTLMAENADNAIRLPELFVNAQLSYANIHFNGNFDVHTGVEMHWHSSYFAPAYDPATRQFYNQDIQQINAFPVIDIFLNAKIKKGRIFVKYNNLLNASIFYDFGYLSTPGYPGQRNIVDFGFDLSLYD
jgi:hypothetical protein